MLQARSIRPIAPERLLVAFAVALLTLSAAAQLLVPAQPAAVADGGPATELEIQARYALGLDHWLRQLGRPTDEADEIVDSLLDAAPQPADRLRLAALAMARGDGDRAARLLAEADDSDPLAALLTSRLAAGERPGPVALDRGALVARHGYFGELALAIADSRLDEVRRDAGRLALLLIVGAGLALALFVVGLVVGGVLFARLRSGRLPSGYRMQVGDDPAPGVPFLEAVILAIFALQILGVLAAGTMAAFEGLGFWPLLLNWLLLPILLWPRLRGLDGASFRAAIGWHRGRGALREIGAGLLGYLAAAPLLVAGFLLSALVASAAEAPPHHPILDWVRGASTLDLLLIASLAVLWAPVVEESLFRGAFFHYLRRRFRPLTTAGATAVAFAALHPQGLAGLPFLITLALTLALIREWRGSLIAPIAVHMVHNGLVVALLFSLL